MEAAAAAAGPDGVCHHLQKRALTCSVVQLRGAGSANIAEMCALHGGWMSLLRRNVPFTEQQGRASQLALGSGLPQSSNTRVKLAMGSQHLGQLRSAGGRARSRPAQSPHTQRCPHGASSRMSSSRMSRKQTQHSRIGGGSGGIGAGSGSGSGSCGGGGGGGSGGCGCGGGTGGGGGTTGAGAGCAAPIARSASCGGISASAAAGAA